MITRISEDEFRITNENPSIDLILSYDEMYDRLTKNNVWSDEQVEELKKFEIGQSTKPVYAFYVIDGVRYSSHNGVMGKPLDPKLVN